MTIGSTLDLEETGVPPISLWISVSDSADMIAPDFTLALQAATYLQRKMTTLFKIRFVDELVVENTVLTKQRNSQYKLDQVNSANLLFEF